MYTSWKFHGKISIESGESYAKGFSQALGAGDPKFEVDIEYCIDEIGTEVLAYSVKGHRSIVLWCNDKDFAEYYFKSNLVVFRPSSEVGLYGGAGFILPRGNSHFSVNEKYEKEAVAGDPCRASDSNCTNVVLKMHFHGANQVGQYSNSGKSIQSSVGGSEIARWNWKGESVPNELTYIETSPVTGNRVAIAEYQFIGSKIVKEPLETRAMIRTGAQLQVQRGRDIYGSGYNPKIADMQQFFEHQKQLSDSVMNQSQVSSGSSTKIGSIFIILGLIVVLGGAYFAKRRASTK